jgi:hypothetical protein
VRRSAADDARQQSPGMAWSSTCPVQPAHERRPTCEKDPRPADTRVSAAPPPASRTGGGADMGGSPGRRQAVTTAHRPLAEDASDQRHFEGSPRPLQGIRGHAMPRHATPRRPSRVTGVQEPPDAPATRRHSRVTDAVHPTNAMAAFRAMEYDRHLPPLTISPPSSSEPPFPSSPLPLSP